jgi:glycosyltransferase involved in cell wall biosynthesis
MPQLKVLHISSGNLYGGVESLLLTLARERLACPDMEPSFALSFQGRIYEELTQQSASVFDLGAIQTRFPWQVALARRRLASLLSKNGFEIVVCHSAWIHAIFGPVVRRMRLPLVFWLHDLPNGKHWIERWASRCPPDLALCNSHFSAGNLYRLFKESTLRKNVLYHPISCAVKKLSPHERADVRAELGTPEDACVFIQVSRLEPYKGAMIHIEALETLAKTPGWFCWFAGGAQRPKEISYLEELKARAKRAGIMERIRFLGERRDIPRLLQAADIFCQPNQQPEPFGIVFIEALYAGLPVISSAFGGVLEIVDRSVGRLVAPHSATDLAGALEEYLSDADLRAAAQAAGPIRASSLCNPSSVLAKLRALLSSEIALASKTGDAALASL